MYDYLNSTHMLPKIHCESIHFLFISLNHLLWWSWLTCLLKMGEIQKQLNPHNNHSRCLQIIIISLSPVSQNHKNWGKSVLLVTSDLPVEKCLFQYKTGMIKNKLSCIYINMFPRIYFHIPKWFIYWYS